MSINSVTVCGHLTRDPETRQAGSTTVTQFGIAVNDRVKNGDTWEDRPNFFDVLVWGSRGESLSRFISKGSKVAISGKLRWSQWETDGQKRSKVEIVADDVDFMSKGEQSDKPKRDWNPTNEPAYTETFEGDIPF